MLSHLKNALSMMISHAQELDIAPRHAPTIGILARSDVILQLFSSVQVSQLNGAEMEYLDIYNVSLNITIEINW